MLYYNIGGEAVVLVGDQCGHSGDSHSESDSVSVGLGELSRPCLEFSSAVIVVFATGESAQSAGFLESQSARCLQGVSQRYSVPTRRRKSDQLPGCDTLRPGCCSS